MATRQDLIQRFHVDPDRVSLFGFAEGGNFALDVGMSHPDLFNAVTTFGANPKLQNMFREYWYNAQKLPLYSVTGEINGTSFQSFYELYQNMLQYGFPSLLVVYQGRGAEWYTAEMAPMFDWLDRQKRVTGIGTLRLPNMKQFEWKTFREADNRFYWIGAAELEKSNILANNPVKGVYPAGVRADIRDGNLIAVEARGLKKVAIYLERNMINWTVPVRVSVNAQAPSGFKAKIIEPNFEFMLEEFQKNGDRKMLFYNKLEFPAR
jgi:pimeloyl-ACP methyl ester carboxylesterase